MRNNFSLVFRALKTPWKVWNYITSFYCYPAARLIFALNDIPWGNSWRFYGLPIVQKNRDSEIKIGDNLQLRSSVRSNPFGVNHPVILCTYQAGAVLEIGSHFSMSGGAICATERIKIGNNVTIGANTTVMDSDFHPSNPEERLRSPNKGQSAPTTIEDNVFIGASSYILRGVTVGSGSVIGTGSVVTTDVKPGTIVFGNPARLVGKV
ncbi:MAG: acyltransferase [Anaerolineales bacterium]|nr:acyltransferase [Anaerolineales bacterium]